MWCLLIRAKQEGSGTLTDNDALPLYVFKQRLGGLKQDVGVWNPVDAEHWMRWAEGASTDKVQ